jgi:hypothetical protein
MGRYSDSEFDLVTAFTSVKRLAVLAFGGDGDL